MSDETKQRLSQLCDSIVKARYTNEDHFVVIVMNILLSAASDSELLDFMETHKGSCWPEKKGGGFTVFVRREGRNPAQPTTPTLREAITKAKEMLEEPPK